jgi:phosphoserine phosphatase
MYEKPRGNGTFYIVDFDRTLADSDKLTDVFIGIAGEHYEIPAEQIRKTYQDMKTKGDTMDTATFVRDQLREMGRQDDWDDLEKQFIHESRSLNMLLAGAAELLQWFASSGNRYGILTYGNPLWQRMKLTAAGFNHVNHIVMEQKEKGKLISSWQGSDGEFRIPEALGRGYADKIVLIDDKAVSFENFPDEPSRGYWVCDPAHELAVQKGSVPHNVERHADLYSVLEQLVIRVDKA